MPTTLREQSLAAFYSTVNGIAALGTVERNPDWSVETPALSEMPACAVYDGPERASDQNVRDLFIVTSVSVEIWTVQETVTAALQDLNDKLGLVRLALGSSTLGGLAQRVRYLGCDQPAPIDLSESPCQASLEAQFEIERFEQHSTPYA